MKRAFLYGMGWTSISLFGAMVDRISRKDDNNFAFDVAVAALLMTLVFFLIANQLTRNRSWPLAIGGWLLGFGFRVVAWIVGLFSINYIDTSSLIYTTFDHLVF